jgi:hypothetical protein
MALGIAASGPGGNFLRLINSGNISDYKFNQETRSIHVFTFRESETQIPDCLDTFDFDKRAICNFDQNFMSIHFWFERYCIDNFLLKFSSMLIFFPFQKS